MREGLRLRDALLIPADELQWRFSRSSGPGGQSVNTTDSRVELSWNVAATRALPEALKTRALERMQDRLTHGVLTIVASEERSQLRNRNIAQRRLVALVLEAISPPPASRRPTKPSKGAKQRRLDSKRRNSEIKQTRRPPQD
ncbi:MAG: aminoacyl-tRNA hydrolase [Longispora sp.]|nr:aminoacyl-tRNA hydrolase [Longispora sp. (in: high G+C Gram-positive bacteria)]